MEGKDLALTGRVAAQETARSDEYPHHAASRLGGGGNSCLLRARCG
jgi:hypothetical protein